MVLDSGGLAGAFGLEEFLSEVVDETDLGRGNLDQAEQSSQEVGAHTVQVRGSLDPGQILLEVLEDRNRLCNAGEDSSHRIVEVGHCSLGGRVIGPEEVPVREVRVGKRSNNCSLTLFNASNHEYAR